MKILLEDMRADWKYWLKKPEVSILHRYAMRGRIFTVAYASKNVNFNLKFLYMIFFLLVTG